jgi:hypothetical protein
MSPPVVRIPSGPITPHGAYHILHDKIPQMALRSYDGTIVINMMGGLAIPDKYAAPERVEIVELRGLIPPWQTIDQKGATQDGVSFVDALYDPAEIELVVRVVGRDVEHARETFRHLCAALDVKRNSELSFFTHKTGRWFSKVRWFKAPVDTISRIQSRSQTISLRLRADDAFWQSYPSVDALAFNYTGTVDEFTANTTSELGANYTVSYSGTGGGFMRILGGQLIWVDDPEDPILTGGRTGVFRRDNFTAAADNMVSETTLGTFSEWTFPDAAYNILGARMPASGTPGATGVFAEFGIRFARIYYKVAGVQTLLRETSIRPPPMPGEKWSLVCGYPGTGNERLFKLRRNLGGSANIEVLSVKETGAGSQMGSDCRKLGGGMHAGAAIFTQATPAAMRYWSGGDNAAITQSKFLQQINMGDQEFWTKFTCVGPGNFKFANGPGSTDMVEFGPLLAGQMVQIRTDPRKRGVVDMTVYPPSPEQQQAHQDSLSDLISFIPNMIFETITQVFSSVLSLFGIGAPIAPPQGNLYSLLRGRFSNPVPAKPAAGPPPIHHVKVEIVNGNADSQIIASGTPLRRYPL